MSVARRDWHENSQGRFYVLRMFLSDGNSYAKGQRDKDAQVGLIPPGVM